MIALPIGRVDFDPLRVPLAAAMSAGDDGAFASRLDDALANARPDVEERDSVERADAAPAPDDAAPPDAPVDDTRDEVAPEAPAATGPRPETTAGDAAGPATAAQAAAAADAARAPRPAAESAATPATAAAGEATATTVGDLLAAPRATSAAAAADFAAAVLAAAPRGGATTNVASAADRIGAVAAPAGAPKAAAVPGAVAGYRTLTPQSVQLVEQARDSVFKQILFKLDRDGGEMRLRLDPPELGELDLHLAVDKAGQLRLSIGAERADLAAALRQDMGRLEAALQQRGLQVVHAEVHARGDGRGSASRDRRERAFDGGGGDDADVVATALRQSGGWVTATGLDYWV